MYYLQMDGVDDRITVPSMTFTEVILDISPTKTLHVRRYWGLPFGAEYLQAQSDLTDVFSSGVQVYVDGVLGTSGTNFITSDIRQTVRIVASSSKTNTSYVFANNTSTFMGGKIYSVKYYNGASLVAHYDMSTQTVNDQVGTNHATLTGGTWVDDGTGGGTNVTVTGVLATATAEGIIPTVSAQQQVSVSAVIANASAEGIATIVSTSSEVNVSSVMAAATAEALAPSVGSFTNVSVNALQASGTAEAIVPSVSVVRHVSLSATIANVTAEALAAIVGGLWKEGTQASTTWSQGSSSSTTWTGGSSASTSWT